MNICNTAIAAVITGYRFYRLDATIYITHTLQISSWLNSYASKLKLMQDVVTTITKFLIDSDVRTEIPIPYYARKGD